MICFELVKNGERVAVAGIDAEHVLSVILSSVDVTDPGPKKRKGIDVYLGGLNSETKQHLHWGRSNLAVGDHVEVRILDLPIADPPTETQVRRSRAAETKTALASIRARRKALLRELKDLDRNEAACVERRAADRSARAAKRPRRRGAAGGATPEA